MGMKGFTSKNIRNIALLGHGGCGKTTFLESALLATGVTTKLGKVEDGNTISDYDKMEIERGYSINTSIVPIEWKGSKLNFIDTPGYPDFVGEVHAALSVAGAAVILVDAGAGIQVGTEQAWKICEKYKTPRNYALSIRMMRILGLLMQLLTLAIAWTSLRSTSHTIIPVLVIVALMTLTAIASTIAIYTKKA